MSNLALFILIHQVFSAALNFLGCFEFFHIFPYLSQAFYCFAFKKVKFNQDKDFKSSVELAFLNICKSSFAAFVSFSVL